LGRQVSAGPPPPYLEHFVDDIVREVAAALVGEPADPAVIAALALADNPSLDVAEVQGRVIGGQDDAEVAAATKLAAETESAYLGVLFDIMHLLMHPGALPAIAVGQIDRQAPTPAEAVRWAGFVFGGPTAGLVADYFRGGFGDGRRITGTPGLESEACKDMRAVRKWLGVLGPPTDLAICRMRWLGVMKKELHERRQAAAA